MRPADTWKDYELLDATDGNRLERWGETILIRPDPQVVWKTPKQSPLWAKADAVYHRSNQGGGEWEYKRRLPEKWKIHCGEGMQCPLFHMKRTHSGHGASEICSGLTKLKLCGIMEMQ